VLSFSFAITALVAAYGCFLVDEITGECVTGPTHVFFAVSRGQTFQIGCAAVLFLGHGFWSLNILRRGTSSVNLGVLLGSSAVITLMAFSISALWGSVSSTMDALNCADLSSLPRPNANTTLKCNGFSSTFSALSVISSLIFLVQGALTGMIYSWQADFVRFESSGDVYESIVTSLSPPARHRFEPIPQNNDEESSAMTNSMTTSMT